MSSLRIDFAVFKDLGWWHWTLTIPFLAASILGQPSALPAAIGLCALVAAYFVLRLSNFHDFPVQVRWAYLILLALGTLPGMHWIHWVQFAGTTSMVTVGFCPLARMLTLLPFNRSEPLSSSFIWKTLWTNPNSGGLLSWADPLSPDLPPCSCSLPTSRWQRQTT